MNNMNLVKTIFVTTKIAGFHRYPEAPAEVSFLKNLHRHLFGVRVEIEVFDDDREIEFFMLKQDVEHKADYLINTKFENSFSCEMIATDLLEWLADTYPIPLRFLNSTNNEGRFSLGIIDNVRRITVTVDEDGENGAIVSNRTGAKL